MSYVPQHGRTSSHRRAYAMALTVASTVGGVTSLSLITASTASAATVAQWDAIAQCESGGRWNLPYGDADSTGGLQIQDRTWADFGGLAFAPHAYLTSKETQIMIAERILASQGPRAWTTITSGCAAPTATLSNMHVGGSVVVPPSAPSTVPPIVPIPVHVNFSDIPAGTRFEIVQPGQTLQGIAAASGISVADLFAANKDIIQDPNLIAVGQRLIIPAAPTRNLPAPPGKLVEDDGQTVPKFVHHTVRPAPPQPVVTTPAPVVPAPAPVHHRHHHVPVIAGSDTVTVRPGDDLTTIANLHQVPGGWPALYSLNHDMIRHGPRHVFPGQELRLPTGSSAAIVAGDITVKRGDTLSSLADKNNVSVSTLYDRNRSVIGSNPDMIFPGQRLMLP